MYQFKSMTKWVLSPPPTSVHCSNNKVSDVVYFFRKAMKAVGVLFGFLGLSNFVFFYNPKDGGFWEDAYLYTNSILQSSQVRTMY